MGGRVRAYALKGKKTASEVSELLHICDRPFPDHAVSIESFHAPPNASYPIHTHLSSFSCHMRIIIVKDTRIGALFA
jgi:hypothetical protein